MKFGVRCSSSYFFDYSYLSSRYQNNIPIEPPCEFPSIQPALKFATAQCEHRPDSSFVKQRRKRTQTRVKRLIKSQETRSKKQKNQKCECPPENVQIGDVKKKSVSCLCQKLKPETLQLDEDHADLIKNHYVTPTQTDEQKANRIQVIRNVASDSQIKNICPTYPCAAPKTRKALRCFCTRKYRNKKKKRAIDKITCKYKALCKKRIKEDETNIKVLRKNLQYTEIPSLYSVYSSILSSLKNLKPKKKCQNVVTQIKSVQTDSQIHTDRKIGKIPCVCPKHRHVSRPKNTSDSSIIMSKRKSQLKQRTQIGDSRIRSKSSGLTQPHADIMQLSESVPVTKKRSKKPNQKLIDSSSQTRKKQPSCLCSIKPICVCDKKFKSVCKCDKFGKAEHITKLKAPSDSSIVTSKSKSQLKQHIQLQPQLSQSSPIRRKSRKKRRHSKSQTQKQTPSYCRCFKDLLCVCDKKVTSVCTCDLIRNTEYISKLKHSSQSYNHLITSQAKNEISQIRSAKKPKRIHICKCDQLVQALKYIGDIGIIHDKANAFPHSEMFNEKTKPTKVTSTSTSRRYFRKSDGIKASKEKSIAIRKKHKLRQTFTEGEYINDKKATKKEADSHVSPIIKTSKQQDNIRNVIKEIFETSKNAYKNIMDRCHKREEKRNKKKATTDKRQYKNSKIKSRKPEIVNKDIPSKKLSNNYIAHNVKIESNSVNDSRVVKDMDHMSTVIKQKKNQRQKPRRHTSPTLSNRTVDNKPSTVVTPLKRKIETRQAKEKLLVANNRVATKMKKKYREIYRFMKQICVSSKNTYKKVVEKQAHKNRRKEKLFSYSYPKKSRRYRGKKSNPKVSKDKASKYIPIKHTVKNKTDNVKTSQARVKTKNNIDDMTNNRDPIASNVTADDHRKNNDSNPNDSQEQTLKWSKYIRRKTRIHDEYTLDKDALSKSVSGLRSINKNTHCKCRDAESQLKSRIVHDKAKKTLDIEDLKLNEKGDIDRNEIKHNRNQQQRPKNIRYNIIAVSSPTSGYRSSASVRYCECTNTESGYSLSKNKLKKKKRNETAIGLPKPAINIHGFEEQVSTNHDKKRSNIKKQLKSLGNHVDTLPSKSTTAIRSAIVKSYCECAKLSRNIPGHKDQNVNSIIEKRETRIHNFLDQMFSKGNGKNILKQQEAKQRAAKNLPVRSQSKDKHEYDKIEDTNINKFKKKKQHKSNKFAIDSPQSSKLKDTENYYKAKSKKSEISKSVINSRPSSIARCKCNNYLKGLLNKRQNLKANHLPKRFDYTDSSKIGKNRPAKQREDVPDDKNTIVAKLSDAFKSSMPVEAITDCKCVEVSKRRLKLNSNKAKKQEPINSQIDTTAIISKDTVNRKAPNVISICKCMDRDRDQFTIKYDFKKRRNYLKDSVDRVKTSSNSTEVAKLSKHVKSLIPAGPIIKCTCEKDSKRHFKPTSNKAKKQELINSKIDTAAMISKDKGPNVISICKCNYKVRDQLKTRTSPVEVAKLSKTFISSMPAGPSTDCVCRGQVKQYFPVKERYKNYENHGQSYDIVDASMNTKRQAKSIYSLPKKISAKREAKVIPYNEITNRRNKYEHNQVIKCYAKSGPEYMSEKNKSDFTSPLEKCYLKKYNNTEGKLWKLKNNLITLENYRATVIPRPMIVSKPTCKQCECRHLLFKNKRLQKKHRSNTSRQDKAYIFGVLFVSKDYVVKVKKREEKTC
ncbi:unnamed protein product [Arctia plantaginis]|uniref:Uncharacterized protein n=2 Tax=Arctia plantaginis TaxID=874455 RepID=A0A8S1ASJ1_ARCPL|nr:unnamed protein product [Arctia plantaginis]